MSKWDWASHLTAKEKETIIALKAQRAAIVNRCVQRARLKAKRTKPARAYRKREDSIQAGVE